MKLIDYSGKLNNHEDYLRVLRQLEQKCKWIEYTVISEDKSFVERFESSVLQVAKKNKWWGTKSSRKQEVYQIKPNPEIFKYLRKFETFCLFETTADRGDVAKTTSFGWNDICFRDDKEYPLLFTTTHEGIIFIRDDVVS